MVFLAAVGLALLAAAGGGLSQIVTLFAGAGFLSGLAGLIAVYVTHRRNLQEGKIENKSVAITELEKAVPGMGEIIQNWTELVHSLQGELALCRADLAACRAELLTTKLRVEELEKSTGVRP